MRTIQWSNETLEALPNVTRRTRHAIAQIEVNAYQLDETNVVEAIAAEIRHAEAVRSRLEWKVFSWDEPTDLRDRLATAGFRIGVEESLAVYDLTAGMAPFQLGATAGSSAVLHVRDARTLADFRKVAEAAFHRPFDLTTRELQHAIENGIEGHDAFVVYAGTEPVSVGRLYTDPRSRFAGLYGGGTIPGYQRQGHYRAIVAARARAAAKAGARYLFVDALPTSLPILTRLGFQVVAKTWPCERIVESA